MDPIIFWCLVVAGVLLMIFFIYLLIFCVICPKCGQKTGGNVIPPPSPLVTDGNFESEMKEWLQKKNGNKALVKFFAPWCGACKSLEPIWDRISKTFQNHPLKIMSVRADEDPVLAKKYEIKGYPTIYLFSLDKDGSTVKKEEMNGDRNGLAEWIRQRL